MRCWCGYLSGARCRLFAYGPAVATASQNSVIPHLNPDRFFTGHRKAYCEPNNCHQSLGACYQSIDCCFTAAVAAFQTHGRRRRETKDSGVSGRGRGNRCLCLHELITIVTPLSRPGSAKTAYSVCLYSVYRKQERSLFSAALEQTSNVPTAIVRRRACGLLYPASGRQSRLSVALHVCFLTGAPRHDHRYVK